MDMLDWLDGEDYKIKFGWMDKQTFGCVDFEKKTIYLNPCLMLIQVAIHEYLHAIHKDPSEKRTDVREMAEMKKMSSKRMRKLAVRLVKMWSKEEK